MNLIAYSLRYVYHVYVTFIADISCIVDFFAPSTSMPPYWNGDQGLIWGFVRIGDSKNSTRLLLGPVSTGGA